MRRTKHLPTLLKIYTNIAMQMRGLWKCGNTYKIMKRKVQANCVLDSSHNLLNSEHGKQCIMKHRMLHTTRVKSGYAYPKDRLLWEGLLWQCLLVDDPSILQSEASQFPRSSTFYIHIHMLKVERLHNVFYCTGKYMGAIFLQNKSDETTQHMQYRFSQWLVARFMIRVIMKCNNIKPSLMIMFSCNKY